MRQGWEERRLGSVCQELFAGGDVPKNNFSKTKSDIYNIPIFSNGENNKGLYGFTNIIRVHKPSVTISARGTIGYSEIRKESFYPAIRLIVATPNEDLLILSFLKYVIESIDFKYSGSSIPQLTVPMIREYVIPLPPLPEQHRIVAILDEAFAAIAKAKANAEQNLRNAREVFEGYLQGVFENDYEVWEHIMVGSIAKVTGGYSFKSSDFVNQGKYQVLRMGNVRPGIIRTNQSPVFIDTIDSNILKKALLQPNDVIITQTGTNKKRDYGFTVIVEEDNFLLNQRIASIRFSNSYLPKYFLYYSWTNLFKDQYFSNESGTVGQGNVGITAITDALVPQPPIEIQHSIVQKLDSLSAEIQKLEALYQKKLEDLEELKKNILQKAFSGELSSILIG